MKIKDILKIKGTKVWTVREDQTVHDAVKILINQKIGALLVTAAKSAEIVGIISERDIVRGCFLNIKKLDNTRVRDLMSSDLTLASPEDEIDDVMAVMTEKRVRHIPVVSAGHLHGIISIGDVVKALIEDSEHQIRHLKEYMYGSAG